MEGGPLNFLWTPYNLYAKVKRRIKKGLSRDSEPNIVC
jgi:hypothetical protein